MSIRHRLEDAHLLLGSRRFDGALLSACTAISATSRKRYPDRKRMVDKDAFTTFLGEEMLVVTAGGAANVFVRCAGADVAKYPNEMMPLQDALYVFVRCSLAHEGRVSDNVEFTEDEGITFEIKPDRITLGGGIMRGLLTVAQFAPENAAEFPQIAEMPQDVVGWMLFGIRRDSHKSYLTARQRRLTELRLNSGFQ